MPNMNPTQQLVPVKPGDPMRADGQNHLVQKFLKMITVGRGLEIERAAQGIVLRLKPQIIPRGGGGGITVHEGVNVAALPDPSSVPQTDFGRVTGIAGDPLGSMYVISPDRTAWLCFTHFG